MALFGEVKMVVITATIMLNVGLAVSFVIIQDTKKTMGCFDKFR